jgi:hypothetical protein
VLWIQIQNFFAGFGSGKKTFRIRIRQKNIPLKSCNLVIMSNLVHLHGRIKKVKFMSRILEKIYVGSETSEINCEEKSIPDPQDCY